MKNHRYPMTTGYNLDGLRFKNLPLVEVALRATIDSPFALSFEDMVRFHSGLGSEYAIQSSSTFENPPGESGLIDEQFPRIGLHGVNEKESLHLNVHSRLLALRWHARKDRSGAAYPGYARMREEMSRLLLLLQESAESELPIIVWNMVYATVVDTSIPINNYLASEFWPSALTSSTKLTYYKFSMQDENAIDLTCDIDSVSWDTGKDTVQGLRLATAGGTKAKGTDVIAPFDSIHSAVTDLFTTLISKNAKTEWEALVE